MDETDHERVARVSRRIVMMFEKYARNIDPDKVEFKTFIIRYLNDRNLKDVKLVKYAELYGLIKQGIKEYLRAI